MSDNKELESVLGGTPSRRGFLKSALMLGGALALIGSTTSVMAAEGDPETKHKKKKKGKGKAKKKGHDDSHQH